MKLGFGKHRTAIFITIVAGLVCASNVAASATEVYTWTDENGVLHFSDSPPDDGDSKKISVEGAYRPGTTGAYPDPAETGNSAEPAQSTGESDGETEDMQSLAQQKRDQLAEQREERREAQEENDRLCGRHSQRLTQMEPARRVFYTNEKGESVRMDDAERVGMVEESKAFLEKNCQ